MSAEKLKRKSFTTAEKLNFVREIEDGHSQKDVCAKYGINQSTLSAIYSKKVDLKRRVSDQPSLLKKKRPRSCKYPQLEEAVALFIQEARAENVPLSGPIVQEKAKVFAARLGITNFEASNGWLTKFNIRNGITYKTICGESAAVNVEIADDWKTNVLPDLLKDYEAKNVFNADETGLFFKCLPGL
jgi:transposase-like protein